MTLHQFITLLTICIAPVAAWLIREPIEGAYLFARFLCSKQLDRETQYEVQL